MKGVVFTELLSLVEQKFGLLTLDTVIQESELQSQGAYTAVGTYDYREILELVTNLSREVGVPVPDLCKAFGEFFFARLVAKYPECVVGLDSPEEFLPHVQDVIHREVLKLYPEAELPFISARVTDPQTTVLDYSSSRPFADVAEGLVVGCYRYFGEECQITREDLSDPPGTQARFTLIREARVATCQN